jgi:Family of unknown function (DUF6236)
MGEAKRRKAADPTGYGRAKRGLVVSPQIEVEGTSLKARSTNLDPKEVRFALLFWDRLAWPASRALHFPSGPDEQLLQQVRVLTRPEYTFNGDVAQGFARGQIQAFTDLDAKEPGLWSLAQGEDSLLLRDKIIGAGDGASVELHRAIPIPDKDVPLNEILEFKQKRHDELHLLRNEIDAFIAVLDKAEDKEAELRKQIAQVDAACADALKVGKEWRFPVRLSNLKVSLDLRPFTTIAAAVSTWGAATVSGFQLPTATAVAGLSAVGSSIKIGADFGLQTIKPWQGPYRYVSQFHQEVF